MPIDPGTRGLRPTIDPANEVTMKNRSHVSHDLIGQFKFTVVGERDRGRGRGRSCEVCLSFCRPEKGAWLKALGSLLGLEYSQETVRGMERRSQW